MNQYEYDFLTSKWERPKGAAFNQVFEFCRNFGWCAGLDTEGRAVLTKQGVRAIKDFERKDRIDVI